MSKVQLEFPWDSRPKAVVSTPILPAVAPTTQPAPIAVTKKRKAEASPRKFFGFPAGFTPGTDKPSVSVAKNIAAIRLSQKLSTEGRRATDKEKHTLAEYIGWGGLSDALDEYRQERTVEALKSLVGDEKFDEIRHSALNAHYTPLPVVRFIWECLKRIGFAGGRVNEPAVGTGNFIGAMPDDLAACSSVHAGELDSLTAGIFGHIYPEARLTVAGYEKTSLPDNFFDAVVGNVPFGDYKVSDISFPKAQIHDYFFMKSLEKVRPGGLIAFLTSSGTMDKANSSVRQYIAKRADLLAAVRFPETMMTATARTTVTIDLIILRRLPLGQNRDDVSTLEWIEVKPFDDGGYNPNNPGRVNQYFVSHPKMVLGTLDFESWRGRVVCKEFEDKALADLFPAVLDEMPANAYTTLDAEAKATFIEHPSARPEDKNGSFALDAQNRLAVVKMGCLHLFTDGSANAHARIRAMMEVRDVAAELLKARGAGDEVAGEAHRVKLNEVYDTFRKKFGLLNASFNSRLFRNDPKAPLLLALEHFDPDNEDATKKAALFEPMTLRSFDAIDSVLDPVSALTVCLNHRGRVDEAYLCKLTALDWNQVWQAIGGKMLFIEPTTRDVLTAEEYLSGDVREKLCCARAAADIEPDLFAGNVLALEAVIPADIPPEYISGQLGSSWIDTDTIRAFIAHLLNCTVSETPTVTHLPALGAWKLGGNDWGVRRGVANTKGFGTDRFTALELIEAGLNLRLPAVYDEVKCME